MMGGMRGSLRRCPSWSRRTNLAECDEIPETSAEDRGGRLVGGEETFDGELGDGHVER
jgi:hypothetical protein